MLAQEYANRLGGKLEPVAVSHETKVPILASGQVDMTIAPLSETDQHKKVVDFVTYSNSSLCMFGKADNPKLKDIKTVADLNRPDIVIAYFTGAAEEFSIPKEFPNAQHRSVTSSGTEAPVEEIMSGRADVAPDDKTSLIQLQKKIPGLVVWPSGGGLSDQHAVLPACGACDRQKSAGLPGFTSPPYGYPQAGVRHESASTPIERSRNPSKSPYSRRLRVQPRHSVTWVVRSSFARGGPDMERRLSGILASDVVGYSRLMEEDEGDTFNRLRLHPHGTLRAKDRRASRANLQINGRRAAGGVR